MPECVMEGECKPVQLEPFVHQVGGHSCVLRFDASTICKPLISREQHFYQTMLDELKEFTPEYRGVIEVTFQEDSDGYMTLVANPSEAKKGKPTKRMLSPSCSPSSSGEGAQSDSDSEQGSSSSARQRFRMCRSGSIEVEGGQDKMFKLVDPTKSKEVLTAEQNPWSLRCHKEQLAKMHKNSNGKNAHKFILLENLASHFKLPCILDLKMGTRQHGDDVSDEKRQMHMRKCASSTSSTLGFRICGMQVYQANSGHYVCHNKYYGRKLLVDGVQDTLYEFLHNGFRLRMDLIDPIVERLRKLHALVQRQNTFRFYSSSLLIMYDGADLGPEAPPTLNPRKSILNISPAFENDMSDSNDSMDQSMDHDHSGGPDHENGAEQASAHQSAHWSDTDNACALQQHRGNGSVDVRMIDFAHTTHQGFRGDKTVHNGPDTGYLFGLENLIRMLEHLRARESV